MVVSNKITTFAAKFYTSLYIFVTMINRTLVRTHVVRNLFAFYKDDEKSVHTALKELDMSFSNTYFLYILLLDFVNELTHFAQTRIDLMRERAIATHTDYRPSLNFVNNRLAKQLFDNSRLRQLTADNHLSWQAAYNNVELIYKELLASQFYQEYQAIPQPTYDDDKTIWKKIFSEIMPKTPELDSALEEIELAMPLQNLFLAADTNIILSFVIKTIKQFKPDSTKDQPLLEMFRSEEELDFAKRLLTLTIQNRDEYSALIDGKLRNWDPERVAYMDRIIMQTAIAELINFPDIAIQVTMNEYIEIAKEYSTESSPAFINGILDQIALDLKRQKKIFK